MMPLFPLPSLKFRTVGFPEYGFKAGMSDGAFPSQRPLKPAPAYAIALAVCIHPSHGRGVSSETPVLSREDDP